MDDKHLPGGYHNEPTGRYITQIPVLWNWDQTNVIGKATIHSDGAVSIDLIPTEDTKRFYDMAIKKVVRSFSVGFTADMDRAKYEGYSPFLESLQDKLKLPWTRKGGIPWQQQGVKTGEGLADKLQARVDEWAPVREFIKKEAEPYMENQKCITDDEGNCISHAKDESCPSEEFPLKKAMEEQIVRDTREVLKPLRDRNPETIGQKACRLVYNYVKARLEKTDTHVKFNEYDVYIVWFSKTLQNWKALLSTNLPDGMYYEVTYNGDQHETYIDAYKKFDNIRIKDPDVGVHIPMVDSD